MKYRIFLFTAIVAIASSCTSIINSMAFFPDRSYKRELPKNASLLSLTTSDGINLRSILLLHEQRSEKIVIYFHGNAGNMYHRLDEAQKIFDTGCDVVISGYRGYDGSSGEPDEEGIYTDGSCVLEYVHGTFAYPYEKIFIYGRSIGTTVAVHTARGLPLAGVILITPLLSAEAFARDKVSDFSSSFVKNSFRNVDMINSLTCPLLVIHGTSDDVIPYSHGTALYAMYNGPKEMVTINGGNHNDLDIIEHDLYWHTVQKFLGQ